MINFYSLVKRNDDQRTRSEAISTINKSLSLISVMTDEQYLIFLWWSYFLEILFRSHETFLRPILSMIFSITDPDQWNGSGFLYIHATTATVINYSPRYLLVGKL